MAAKKKPERQRSELGIYLAGLREGARLSTAVAARRLGLKSRQVLDSYEIGRTFPPVPVLIRLAKLYGVSREEVLEKAYWPQLVLLPLIAIMDPEPFTEEQIEDLEKGLYEAERKKLTEYILNLLNGRTALVR